MSEANCTGCGVLLEIDADDTVTDGDGLDVDCPSCGEAMTAYAVVTIAFGVEKREEGNDLGRDLIVKIAKPVETCREV